MRPVLRVEDPPELPLRGTSPTVPVDEPYLRKARQQARSAHKAARSALAGDYTLQKALWHVAIATAEALACLDGWLDEGGGEQ